MKKTFIACLSTIACYAFAAGPYDGIYQSTLNKDLYLSVHQNGGFLIVAAFATLPASGVSYYQGGAKFTPQRADVWDLQSGPINGNVAATQGESTFGACLETGVFRFDQSGVTYTLSAVVQTNAGRAQGYPCSTLPPGIQARFNRVF